MWLCMFLWRFIFLRMVALCSFLQETSLDHVWISRLARDGFGATLERSGRNIIWVVACMQIEVERCPSWYSIFRSLVCVVFLGLVGRLSTFVSDMSEICYEWHHKWTYFYDWKATKGQGAVWTFQVKVRTWIPNQRWVRFIV